MYIKLLREEAQVPKQGSEGAIGYDLYTVEDTTIVPGSCVAIPMCIAVKVPEGTYSRIAPRSSLAVKSCIDVGAGVIDPDYRGELKVLLINNSLKEFKVQKGERIAQLILEQALSPRIITVPDLDNTLRGESGFGSTGTSDIIKVEITSISAVADSTLLIF